LFARKRFEEQETLKEYFSVLNKQEVFVIKAIVFHGYTIKALSDKINFSNSLFSAVKRFLKNLFAFDKNWSNDWFYMFVYDNM